MREHGTRILFHGRDVFSLGARERMVRRIPPTFALFPLKHGKINNENEGELIGILGVFSDIRLVGIPFCYGRLVGNAREGILLDLFFGEQRLYDFGVKLFREIQDIFLGSKRHLKIQLSEFGLPVPAGIFVSHTAGDLEVALKSRHHQ